jgi:hypothetical protein
VSERELSGENYRVSATWLSGRRFSIAFAAVGIVFFLWLASLGLKQGTPWAAGASFTFAALLLSWGLSAGRELLLRERRTVSLSDYGILHPVSGRSVAWTGLTALRTRNQHVELWGRGGHSGVELDFFIDEFENLLAHVLSRVSLTAPRTTSFRRSIGSIALLVAVFGGVAAWFARTALLEERPWGLALSLAFLAPLAWECWEGLFVVRIFGDRVVLRTLFRERVVFLTSVRELRVSRGRQRLGVWLLCESERAQVCPAGCDPFDVYFAVRAALAERAGK